MTNSPPRAGCLLASSLMHNRWWSPHPRGMSSRSGRERVRRNDRARYSPATGEVTARRDGHIHGKAPRLRRSSAMTTTPQEHPVRQGIAAGTSIGAAILLVTVGVLSILEGISAVANDNLFVVGIDYVYQFDTTTWGWIHIVLGILLVIAALG